MSVRMRCSFEAGENWHYVLTVVTSAPRNGNESMVAPIMTSGVRRSFLYLIFGRNSDFGCFHI
jgi:hypothetical protein